MEFEETRLYWSHQQLHAHPPQSGADNDDDDAAAAAQNNNEVEEDTISMNAVRRHFREFLRKCSQLIEEVMWSVAGDHWLWCPPI